jgi:hypothetical protein
MKRSLRVMAVFSFLLLAIPAVASNFRAADVVYLNAAGRLAGAGGALFKTDVVITNVSNAAVDVDAVFLEPTGGGDLRGSFDTDFVAIGTLQPGNSVLIEDIVQTTFGKSAHFGHMIFYSCRVGGNCNDCDANPADCLPITVQGRVYDDGDPGRTVGQLFSGLPWYSYISTAVSQHGLDTAWITGIRQDAAGAIPGYRSNIGVVNASEYSSTVIRVRLFRNNGTLFGSANVSLGPLGHRQQNVAAAAMFPGFTGVGYAVLDQISVTPTNPDDPDEFIRSGAPGFFAYGSVLDNATNDPTTLEAMYPVQLDFNQVYAPKTGDDAAPQPRRLVRRP